MPPVTLSAVVDLAKIKMKWKETYVSEGLNHKVVGASPNGIYRGLKLIQNITSPRQVEVSAGVDLSHAAVHQSAAGFSTTYFDVAGASTILSLSSASLDNQETVIVLSVNYTVGADTTANWIAYPIADWNALTDAQRAEKIVLGTVNVPAPATNITTAMILPNRRTLAWDNVSPGAVSWTPVVKNGGFEYSLDDGVFLHAAAYWQYSQHTNGEWRVQSASPYAGVRALAFNQLIAAAPTAWIDQYIGIPAVAGQLIKYKFRVRNLKVPTGGTLTMDLLFADTSLGAFVSSSISVPMTSIDASYRLIEGIVAAPATSLQLFSVRFTNTLNQSSTGIAFRLDDVQVWVETGTALKAPSSEEQTRRPVHTESIIIESSDDPLADYFGPAALLSMPVNDELWLTRRDGDVTVGNPIQLALRTARLTQIGSDLLNTVARATLARFSAPASTVASALTLIHESIAAGSYGYRTYVSFSGETIHTVNAVWNSGTLQWSKDLNGVVALRQYYRASLGQVKFQFRASDTAWADVGWLDGAIFDGTGGLTLGANLGLTTSGTASVAVGSGGVTVAANGDVTVAGTGKFKHGTRTIRWMTNENRAAFLSGSFPSNSVGESFGTGSTASGTWFFPVDPWPDHWRLLAARFFLPSTIVGSGGLLTLQERHGSSYTSISSDYSFTNGENGLKTFAGISAATHAFPLGIRMNLQVGSTTTALVSYLELDYDVP